MSQAAQGRRRAQKTAGLAAVTFDNSSGFVYRPLTLFAGDVFLDEVGMLEPRELNGEAVLDVTDDAALRLAEGDQAADRRPQVRRDGDRRARLRQVDDPATHIAPVRQDQARQRPARGEAAVAAIFRKVEDVAVGEPGELRGKLVAFAAKPFSITRAIVPSSRPRWST
jgi:hypothetical protein